MASSRIVPLLGSFFLVVGASPLLAAGCSGTDGATAGGADETPASDAGHDASTRRDGGSKDAGSKGDGGKAGTGTGPQISSVPAPHGSYPVVPDNGGKRLSNAKLVLLVSAGDPFEKALNDYADALVKSNWLKAVGAEYGVSPPTKPVVHIQGPAITGSTLTIEAMEAYIASAIRGKPSAAGDGQTLYFLILPPGVVAVDDRQGENKDCKIYGGYHTEFSYQTFPKGDVWGMGQRCSPMGSGLTELQESQVILSHEFIEAATDPHAQPSGWIIPSVDPPYQGDLWAAHQGAGEVGDLCATTFVHEGSYLYQRIYSNAAARAGDRDPCIPAPSDPYFDTTVPSGAKWEKVRAGGSVSVDIAGWATAPTNDWAVAAQQTTGTETFGATLHTPRTLTKFGQTIQVLNNGERGSVTITAPSSAASGSWAVVNVYSESLDFSSGTAELHSWPIGVYVP